MSFHDRASFATAAASTAAVLDRAAREAALDAAAPRSRDARLGARRPLTRVGRRERRTEAACHALEFENHRLHTGYADALDRAARLMAERDGLAAQNAALRARLAVIGGARG